MANSDLLARSLAAVWHPCTQMKRHEALPLIPITRGEGAWLVDADGRRYLDTVSSWWVNLFGHGEPRIKAAIKTQLDELEHVMLAGFTHEPVVRLSERLGALTGLGHAFYGSDGASAVEIALKMAAHYWRNVGHPAKHRFVYLEGSYHGETAGALAVTDVPVFRDAYAPLIGQHFVAPSPDPRRALPGESADDVVDRAASRLEHLLARHHGEIAALIVEPLVQGAAGMAMHSPRYLQLARAACDRHHVLLIADEIAVGFGRSGSMFASQGAGVQPDLMCLSKGITGGFLPLACVLCSDTLYQAFYHDDVSRGFLHSHSYTGNPLACAAANAVLDIFETDDVIATNHAKAERWDALFVPLRAHPNVTHFRRTGMIWAFDVSDAGAGFAQRYFAAALEQRLLVRPIGNTVYFMPPYVMSDDEARLLADGALAALDAALASGDHTQDLPLA
ncbi:adenosylmethionine--8-amino-7-oxononanoate transaminase [Jeongeupia naejangsanensis]|uniref:Adenosylmethionine-8-amino-7-oxononanoate aminotransferase n=1 Tax=Jeongeupia naejangsanensis TaxID=613195 RepID=A0ABS2BNP7_9NEIS|nr:adenosylmethionine--8-amino-7-oxononanoate transaminase [Jeongeupia naejangsanensis]MBM3117247.1 adenosylmethionine--8-amino-7-oxononanoate transaminase [Jeongeupia naejangsanensis]